MRCWGSDWHGQLNRQRDIVGPETVAIGGASTCVIDARGPLCFGENTFLGLHRWTDDKLTSPRLVSDGEMQRCIVDQNNIHCMGSRGAAWQPPSVLAHADIISSVGEFSCGLAGGNVYCWGEPTESDYGQLNVPQDLTAVTDLAAGYRHVCVTAGGAVRCWGKGDQGQTTVPANLSNPRKVAVGMNHSCGIFDQGVVCWGDNSSGQSTVPDGLINPRSLALGDRHSCALTDSGIKCWGAEGMLDVPQDVNGATEIVSGLWHACVIAKSQWLKCWGNDFQGQTTLPRKLDI